MTKFRIGLGLMALMFTLPLLAQDFGDHRSETLTRKAWEAMGQGDLETALVYADKCQELYLAEAKKQQASLADFAPADTASTHWALNDVGTSLFIEGQILEKQGKNTEAIAVYKQLVAELKFTQCWDTQGWFWKPAEAAEGRLKQLAFDAMMDD